MQKLQGLEGLKFIYIEVGNIGRLRGICLKYYKIVKLKDNRECCLRNGRKRDGVGHFVEF